MATNNQTVKLGVYVAIISCLIEAVTLKLTTTGLVYTNESAFGLQGEYIIYNNIIG